MMRYRYWIVLLGLMISVSAMALDQVPEGTIAKRTGAATVDNSTYIDANAILMFATNHGGYGHDLAGIFGLDVGTFYPYTDTASIRNGTNINSPLYAGGLWLGGIVNDTIKVAVSEYVSEYVPGPMDNGTYQPDDPSFKVYKLYSDSLESNPNSDYLNWPVDQGAPVNVEGKPKMLGDQMLWAVYNDADPAQHTPNSGSTAPLKVEVQHTFWASGDIPTCIFMRYKIFNRGVDTIKSCYLSLWADPDLGGASDDLTGCDSLGNLFFCYNGDNDDSQYGATPPAIGYKILYGPLVPSPEDTAIFDGRTVADYRNLGMASSMKYVGGADPANYNETYNIMRGLLMNGSDYINPSNGNVTKFMLSGDPISGTGDVDFSPGNRLMMGSCGPFTFNPGDSQYVLAKLAIGLGSDRLNSITILKAILNEPYDFPSGVDDENPKLMPERVQLGQNYPNPFNHATVIDYSIPRLSHVSITVYDILGREVTTLIDAGQKAGSHQIHWNGTDYSGKPVASGIYLYCLKTENVSEVRKMLLLK